MAMMSDLFAKFEDLRMLVEKVSEGMDKGSDRTETLVSVCTVYLA